MKDKHMLSIALIVAVLGLLLLFYFSHAILLPDSAPVREEQGRISVTGKVVSVDSRSSLTRMVICQETYVTIFDEVAVRPGQEVRVLGSISEYRNRSELVAEKITSLS